MENKKFTVGLVAVLVVSLCLNVYLYMGNQNNKATIAGLQASYSEKEQQLSELQEQLSAMTASLETSEGKIAELTANLETVKAENEALTADLASAEAEIEAQEVAEVPTTPTEPVTETTPSGSEVTTIPQEQAQQQAASEFDAWLESMGGTFGPSGNSGSAGNDSGSGIHFGDLE